MHASYHAWGTIPDDKGEKIDFIFITPGIKVKRAHVWNSLIGEGRYLSDHHPHYADLDAKTL
jgi:endonuclease/exonuclease/phosphatase family metal-dependent hydrolase